MLVRKCYKRNRQLYEILLDVRYWKDSWLNYLRTVESFSPLRLQHSAPKKRYGWTVIVPTKRGNGWISAVLNDRRGCIRRWMGVRFTQYIVDSVRWWRFRNRNMSWWGYCRVFDFRWRWSGIRGDISRLDIYKRAEQVWRTFHGIYRVVPPDDNSS